MLESDSLNSNLGSAIYWLCDLGQVNVSVLFPDLKIEVIIPLKKYLTWLF